MKDYVMHVPGGNDVHFSGDMVRFVPMEPIYENCTDGFEDIEICDSRVPLDENSTLRRYNDTALGKVASSFTPVSEFEFTHSIGEFYAVNEKYAFTADDVIIMRAALEHGIKLVDYRLERAKNNYDRENVKDEKAAIISALETLENCYPETAGRLELGYYEMEVIIYCLQHAKNAKSKKVRQLMGKLDHFMNY